jgi:DNA-binding NarL/FixJ family response regulator
LLIGKINPARMTSALAWASLSRVMPQHARSPHLLRVLVVDDQESARQGLVALLSLQPDLEIVGEAANGKEAIRLTAQRVPEAVLMDIEMPLMDGLEATRWIKQVFPRIKVVILSIHDELRERAMDVGADTFLMKGEPPERLLTILKQMHEQAEPGES